MKEYKLDGSIHLALTKKELLTRMAILYFILLSSSLIHEFGHALADKAIDPGAKVSIVLGANSDDQEASQKAGTYSQLIHLWDLNPLDGAFTSTRPSKRPSKFEMILGLLAGPVAQILYCLLTIKFIGKLQKSTHPMFELKEGLKYPVLLELIRSFILNILPFIKNSDGEMAWRVLQGAPVESFLTAPPSPAAIEPPASKWVEKTVNWVKLLVCLGIAAFIKEIKIQKRA